MRYFICALEGEKISLAVSAEHTERIIPVAQTQTVEYKTQDKEVFLSLPVLLRQKNTAAVHGIVLKSAGDIKTVLLVPRIDIDAEIPEKDIHRLPGVFDAMFRYFSGACFSGQNLVLILNTVEIINTYCATDDRQKA